MTVEIKHSFGPVLAIPAAIVMLVGQARDCNKEVDVASVMLPVGL